MIDIGNKTIGEIVAEDYRAAAIFESFGIDFCCKGNRTIDAACEGKKINPDQVHEKLNQLNVEAKGNLPDFASWPSDLLTDYIEKKHHRYISDVTPVLQQFLEKLCNVHGGRHPELFEIAREFNDAAGELAMHMKKEELLLFPYVRNLVEALKDNKTFDRAHFGSVENPIRVLMQEHSTEGERFSKISELSSNFTVPADGCTTFRVAFQMLEEFEKDLHLHIHLENNILFPKAAWIEQKIFA
jgi:regulator of cell morphogenesis and NO signaling